MASSGYLEGAARQPDSDSSAAYSKFFLIVMGLVDAIPMIAVGLGLYVHVRCRKRV